MIQATEAGWHQRSRHGKGTWNHRDWPDSRLLRGERGEGGREDTSPAGSPTMLLVHLSGRSGQRYTYGEGRTHSISLTPLTSRRLCTHARNGAVFSAAPLRGRTTRNSVWTQSAVWRPNGCKQCTAHA